MAGFFQNLFLGDPNRPDFTPEMLPKNRLELFWAMLKQSIFNLAKANLIYLLFSIPLCIWVWTNIQVMQGILAQSAQTAIVDIFKGGYFLVFALGMILCFTIQGPAMAALTRLTRNWARDESAYAWADFWSAIKANWKQGLLVGLINGVFFFVCALGIYFYAFIAEQNAVYAIFRIMLIVVLVLYLSMNLYLWPMLVTYNMRLIHIFSNAILFSIGRLPFSLLFTFITALPVVICIAAPIAVFYYFLIGFAFHSFINVSYTNGVFDKYINSQIEGATVNRGLRPK